MTWKLLEENELSIVVGGQLVTLRENNMISSKAQHRSKTKSQWNFSALSRWEWSLIQEEKVCPPGLDAPVCAELWLLLFHHSPDPEETIRVTAVFFMTREGSWRHCLLLNDEISKEKGKAFLLSYELGILLLIWMNFKVQCKFRVLSHLGHVVLVAGWAIKSLSTKQIENSLHWATCGPLRTAGRFAYT